MACVRTVADCAGEMGVSPETVVRWIAAGHLVAFVPPGAAVKSGKRGPKGYRVLPDDWTRFLEAHRYTGRGEEQAAAPGPRAAGGAGRAAPGEITGTDGVNRRRRRSGAGRRP